MMRAVAWLTTLTALALIGALLWPSDHRSFVLGIVVAATVVLAMSLPVAAPRGAAVTLATVSLIVLGSTAAVTPFEGDLRPLWTGVLVAVVWRSGVLRLQTLITAGVLAVGIAPPSDISLLNASPPVLLQVTICVVAIAAQQFERPSSKWWRLYRIGEPILLAIVAAAVVAPFARNGLTLGVLIIWYAGVAAAATAVAVPLEMMMGKGPSLADPAAVTLR
jgi:hypothetical protein